MNGPEHYRMAEQLLAEAVETSDGRPADTFIAQAQVHATLATVAAPTLTTGDDLMALLLGSLASFQMTAQYASLQHPRMRGYLAEHLADSLAAAGYATGRTR